VAAFGRAIGISGMNSDWAYDSIIANNIIENVPDMGICPGQSDGVVIANNNVTACSQSIPSFAIDVSIQSTF
jgi:parallel beta-helix repeat protein